MGQGEVHRSGRAHVQPRGHFDRLARQFEPGFVERGGKQRPLCRDVQQLTGDRILGHNAAGQDPVTAARHFGRTDVRVGQILVPDHRDNQALRPRKDVRPDVIRFTSLGIDGGDLFGRAATGRDAHDSARTPPVSPS